MSFGVLAKDKHGQAHGEARRKKARETLEATVGKARTFQARRVKGSLGCWNSVRIGSTTLSQQMLLNWRTYGLIELVAGRYKASQIYRRLDV